MVGSIHVLNRNRYHFKIRHLICFVMQIYKNYLNIFIKLSFSNAPFIFD